MGVVASEFVPFPNNLSTYIQALSSIIFYLQIGSFMFLIINKTNMRKKTLKTPYTSITRNGKGLIFLKKS